MTDALFFEIRSAADDDAGWTIEGRAVPYGETIELMPGFFERVEAGAVMARSDIKLFNAHRNIIGKILSSENRSDGFYIRAKISQTIEGHDTMTLIRDGALNKFSIGFKPVEYRFEDDGATVVHTKIDVREVSTVAIPAYDNAEILSVRSSHADNVREDSPSKEEVDPMVDEVNADDVAELRSEITDLQRSIALFGTREVAPVAPRYSNPGAMLKALVEGNEEARSEYDALVTRDFTGGTMADANVGTLDTTFMGDITKWVEDATVLHSFFGKGTLPAKGSNLEFVRINSESHAVSAQGPEGTALLESPAITWVEDTTPVHTEGGYFSLSFQAINRSALPVVSANLKAQSNALGRRLEVLVRTAYDAARTANAAATLTVADGDSWADYQGAVIDAAVYYKLRGVNEFSLIAGKDAFKRLAALSDITTGKPVLDQDSGRVQVKSLTGEIFSVQIVLDLLETDPDRLTFASSEALRTYEDSVKRLQASNILTLTGDFSVYENVAVADEHPALIVPVTVTA